ncbi:hypothetical protein K1719_013606 [Acacia pycnantha]|nr:hypothetical protein K1719_013606 [Acacia pycnantha]
MAENAEGYPLLVVKHRASAHKGGWHAAIFIVWVEFAERFAYYGLCGNLMMYLTNALQEPYTTAAMNINTWKGFSSLFPLLGGFVADSYLGRFNTILASSFIYLLGMLLLLLSVSAVKNATLFFVGLYVLSVGDGGYLPCVQTFAANQFPDDTSEGKNAKSSFFNWWYLSTVTGSLLSTFLLTYLQDNVGWVTGLGVPAVVLVLALALFLLGVKRYRKDGPTGSPFTRMAQVFVAAVRKWLVKTTCGPHSYWYGEEDGVVESQSLAPTSEFRFLDNATIIDDMDASSKTKNPWRLCSVTQVEEVKLVLRLIPIWLSCLMFTVVQAQLHTFAIKQSSTMVRSIGPHFLIPPASLQGLVGVFILIAVPIYDRVFVPFARKFTGHPSGITVLQRIGFGLLLSVLNMIVAALVEAKRELFYDQVSETMRSLGAATYLCLLGFGSLASNVVITIVEDISSRTGETWLGDNLNRAHLDSFYLVLAGLSAVSLWIYIWLANKFVYKKINVRDDHNLY